MTSAVKTIAKAKIAYIFINCSKLGSGKICGSSISSAISMSVSETRDMIFIIYHSGDIWILRISSKPNC